MPTSADYLSARAIARDVATKAMTAEASVRQALDVIADREPTIGAWKILAADQALAEARAFDKAAALSETSSLLGGVPIAVKDNIDVIGLPSGQGSPIYDDSMPAADAACVVRAKQAGAIVLGKTVLTEFAYFQPGRTANPHNTAHTPGGSSQGSAAAVAAGMVPLAYGTQTAGSVIRPAAYCGVVGYKPSWGMIPRQGVKVISDWLDTVGVFARDVEDAAFFVAALTKRDYLRPRGDGGPLRFTVLRPPYPGEADQAAVAALDAAVVAVRAFGHRVDEVATPPVLDAMPRLHRIVMAYDMCHALAHERHAHGGRLSAVLKTLLDEGVTVAPRVYDAALAEVRGVQRDEDAVFAGTDVLLSLSAPGEAPKGLHGTGDPAFNRAWTLLQWPCVTVPAGFGPNGLPLGVQIVGRSGQDAAVLQAALALQTALATRA